MRKIPVTLTCLGALSAAVLIWVPPSFGGPGSAELALSPAQQAQQAQHARAMAAFREGRFPAAYGRFIALADAGHAPSAEISLVMWRHGRDLLGHEWAATPPQVQRWNALVVQRARFADGGRAVGESAE